MARRTSGSAPTPAFAALARAGIEATTHTYAHDTRSGSTDRASFGQVAASALGVSPQRVLKTLLVDLDGSLVVAVVPVSSSLDLRSVAAALDGKRARLADPHDAERATGYVVGGISPFGQKQRHPTVVDASVTEHATVFVSGGRRGLEIELAPQDLVSATDAVEAPISRSSS